MKMLNGVLMTSMLLSFAPSLFSEDANAWQKERAEANDAAEKALSEFRQILAELTEDSFSSEPIDGVVKIGKTEVPPGTSKINALRQQIQYLVARVDLAQDYPATKFKGEETIDKLLKGKDFYGVSAAQNYAGFIRKQQLIEKLFELVNGKRSTHSSIDSAI